MKNLFFSTLSHEVELLLLCSRFNIGKHEHDRINWLCSRDLNWDLLKKLIIQNRVSPIVYNTLKIFKPIRHQSILTDLKKAAKSTGTRSFFFTIYLQQLLNEFRRCRIFAVPFKGPALSEFVYGDITYRVFSDLDILVSKRDAHSAFQMLKQIGLQPQLDLSSTQLSKYIKNEDNLAFYDFKKNLAIELHWEISGLYLSESVTLSELKDHIETGQLNKTEIACLSKEALLVYLCVHGAKHGWEHLEQLCCVAELIKANDRIDWNQVEYLSQQWQCKKMLFLGLYLAMRLLNAPLPENLCDAIEKDCSVPKLAGDVISCLFDEDNADISRFSVFHLKVRDKITDKVRYGLRLLFRPTDKEWQHFPLPAAVSFLHYIFRPFRLLIFKLRGLDA